MKGGMVFHLGWPEQKISNGIGAQEIQSLSKPQPVLFCPSKNVVIRASHFHPKNVLCSEFCYFATSASQNLANVEV